MLISYNISTDIAYNDFTKCVQLMHEDKFVYMHFDTILGLDDFILSDEFSVANWETLPEDVVEWANKTITEVILPLAQQNGTQSTNYLHNSEIPDAGPIAVVQL